MAKLPIDPSDLAKLIAEELKKAGKTASTKAVNDVMKSVGGATAKRTGRRVPKITPKTATGGAGRKPPKPPKAGAAAPAPKPKGPKKPSGGVKKELTRAEKRDQNIAKHYAEREKWLAEKRVESQAAKEAKRAENRAAWAKRQDEMEARRLAGREKYNKKKGTK